MTVAKLMREDVVTTGKDRPVNEVATLMREEGVGSVIVEEEGRPLGVVTDRDIAVRIAADRLDSGQMTAEGVMTGDLATVAPETGIFEVCSRMHEEGIRRMPVVDAGQLVGIITLDDLSILLTRELGNLAGVIESESPPY